MGIAYICLNEDFSSAGKPQVHPVVKTPPEMLAIVGPDTINTERNEGQYAPAFTPMLTPYRSVIWSVESGSEYARITPNGKVVPIYDATDPDTLHDVTIKATSETHPSISAIKDIKVKAYIGFSAASPVLVKCDERRPQKGKSYIIRGYIDGDESVFVKYQPLDSAYDGIATVTDNGDGTATLNILTDQYVHGVPVVGYNSVYPTVKNTTYINLNDYVIINSADSTNSANLMDVFYSNGKSESPDKMWKSEAWVMTTI